MFDERVPSKLGPLSSRISSLEAPRLWVYGLQIRAAQACKETALRPGRSKVWWNCCLQLEYCFGGVTLTGSVLKSASLPCYTLVCFCHSRELTFIRSHILTQRFPAPKGQGIYVTLPQVKPSVKSLNVIHECRSQVWGVTADIADSGINIMLTVVEPCWWMSFNITGTDSRQFQVICWRYWIDLNGMRSL